jgi:hypothetical protein
MASAGPAEFDIDFASCFQPPLQPVEVLRGVDFGTFRHRFRDPGVPVILEGETDDWPAMARWPDLAYLRRVAGEQPVYVRDLDRGSINGRKYSEPYQSFSFADFLERISGSQPQNLYLTQGVIRRPTGILRAFERELHPALLTVLAEDLPVPRFWQPDQLLEANLWLGPGSHASALHFDEFDNLNAVIAGSKRWLLFPAAQADKLTAGARDAQGTIVRGFHAGEPRRFEPAVRCTAHGYQCVTRPGQLLYVPRGMWHQVFSGPGLSIAVNFWFFSFARDAAKVALNSAHRYVGFRSRKRLAVALATIYLDAARRLARYGIQQLMRLPPPEPAVGPTSYR